MTLRSGQAPASAKAWRQLLEEGQHRTALEFSEIVAVVIGRARNGLVHVHPRAVHPHSATSPPSRSRMPAGTGTAAEVSSDGGYAVAVASERSAADADAVFRSLQAKFPNQLGGREPIVRRTDLGPEGIYYRASIGPFVSMKAAARVCSSLKAAGESCLVEKN
jgi:hypothetical protein